jgi:hypothetical protein
MLRRHARGEPGDFRGRALERHPFRQPRHDGVVVADGAVAFRRCHPRGQPYDVVACERAGQRRSLRHDADDGVWDGVDADAAAEHGRIAAVAPPPQPIAEHDDRRRRVRILVAGKTTAKLRSDSKQRHQGRCDARASDPLRTLVVARERVRVAPNQGKARETIHTVPGGVVEGCCLELEDVVLGQGLPDENQPRRIAIRQRLQ